MGRVRGGNLEVNVYMCICYTCMKLTNWIKFLNNFLKAAAAFVGLGSSE